MHFVRMHSSTQNSAGKTPHRMEHLLEKRFFLCWEGEKTNCQKNLPNIYFRPILLFANNDANDVYKWGILEIRRPVSARGECRGTTADADVLQHNRAWAAVINLHSPRVSQLLLPSCSFPNMRPATNSFSWLKGSSP